MVNMELNINSPLYYTNQYGVIDDVYWMCREMAAYVRDKQYSNFVDIVGITPVVAPKRAIEEGQWRETKQCKFKSGFAYVSLSIDYEEFVNGDIDMKKQLIIKNILASVKAIHKKAKIDFDEFNRDIMCFCRRNGIML
jgi:hypothetical protein